MICVRAMFIWTQAAKATSAPPKLQPLQNDRSGVMDDVLSLANIRESLIRQEDTIIFSLIERAQFAVNSAVYTPGKSLQTTFPMPHCKRKELH